MPAVRADLHLSCDRCGAEIEVQGFADGVLDLIDRARRFTDEHARCVFVEPREAA